MHQRTHIGVLWCISLLFLIVTVPISMLFSLSANLHTIIDVNNFVVVKDLGTAILVSTKDTNPFPTILAGVSFLLF